MRIFKNMIFLCGLFFFQKKLKNRFDMISPKITKKLFRPVPSLKKIALSRPVPQSFVPFVPSLQKTFRPVPSRPFKKSFVPSRPVPKIFVPTRPVPSKKFSSRPVPSRKGWDGTRDGTGLDTPEWKNWKTTNEEFKKTQMKNLKTINKKLKIHKWRNSKTTNEKISINKNICPVEKVAGGENDWWEEVGMFFLERSMPKMSVFFL